MAIELLIHAEAQPDRREKFEAPIITVRRDPTSVIRFDMAGDREVSTRHAEFCEEDGSDTNPAAKQVMADELRDGFGKLQKLFR